MLGSSAGDGLRTRRRAVAGLPAGSARRVTAFIYEPRVDLVVYVLIARAILQI
ncbi:hypothetical protein [Brevibacterium luteolum]|uniref:hypothetical protein n=1 Tax=Brevibacterium luteolum TaxID=199591 RepID=UPI0015E11B91|nr:hypothetical protein [Brevibacterium luteolum]